MSALYSPKPETVANAEIIKTLRDIKSAIDSQHEILIHKLSVLESILGNARDFLEQISKNIKQ